MCLAAVCCGVGALRTNVQAGERTLAGSGFGLAQQLPGSESGESGSWSVRCNAQSKVAQGEGGRVGKAEHPPHRDEPLPPAIGAEQRLLFLL